MLWLLAIAAPAAGSPPPAWWDASWSHRAQLRLDNTGRAEGLVDFPALVVLEEGATFQHALAEPGGADLRFVDGATGQLLAYDIDGWDPAGTSRIWVRVPRIEPGELHRLWMYFGNPGAPPGEDAPSTWSDAFVAVWHLDPTLADATGTAPGLWDGTTTDVEGIVGRAQEFDGGNDQIQILSEAPFDLTQAFTVSAWFRIDGWTEDWDTLVAKGDGTWRLHRCGGDTRVAFSVTYPGAQTRDQCSAAAVTDGSWHHVAGVYDGAGQQQTLWLDGVALPEPETRTPLTTDRPVWLGNNPDFPQRSLDGMLDEVRVQSVARSTAWLDAERANVVGGFVSWCSAWLGDADDDGVCDDEERCPGFDDAADADVDGAPDACDPCPGEADERDDDLDGVYTCADCDDTDETAHPGGTEVPGNGVDEDCLDGDTPAPLDTGAPIGPAPADTGAAVPDTALGSTDGGSDREAPVPSDRTVGAAGCACSSRGGGGWVGGMLLVGLVAGRRRMFVLN